ncbi:MAG: hypothetical protein ACTSW7_01165 [Candidatus Thorarchaeota archaeon]|nr:hypothetical protein [Thermoplasmatales archaeon]
MPLTPDDYDVVQVVKQEWPNLGGKPGPLIPYSLPIEPLEDGIEAGALFVVEVGRRNKNVAIWANQGKMIFKDIENPGVGGIGYTLTQILTAILGQVRVSANDTIAGYLNGKLIAGTGVNLNELNDGGNEALEISAEFSEIFSVDYDTATNIQSTSSTTAQDAGVSVEIPVDGDYVVFFDSETRVSNSNGDMAISLSAPNTIIENSSTVRIIGGNKRSSSIIIYPFIGLSTGDVIKGLFRKEGGPGTAYVYNRSMFLMRIG